MDFLKYLKEEVENNPKLREMYYKKDLENLLLDIGMKVENARIKKGMKQEQLAKKLKTSQSYISRLENGSLSPSIKMLQKIAEVFGGFAEFKISYPESKNNMDTQEVSEGILPNYFYSGSELEYMAEKNFLSSYENKKSETKVY